MVTPQRNDEVALPPLAAAPEPAPGPEEAAAPPAAPAPATTDSRAHARYARALLAFTAVLVAAAVGFNYLVDPYAIHGAPRHNGLNARKPALGRNLRMAKAHAVRALKPKAVVLGSSRADYALDPDHPGWAAEPVYNLALYGANAYELLRYFQHAHAVQPLEQVVLALDFYMFNAWSEPQPDFDERRLAAAPDGSPKDDTSSDARVTLASLDALSASLSTLRGQGGGGVVHLDNGLRASDDDGRLVRRRGGHRRVFLSNEQHYLRNTWFPPPAGRFALEREDGRSPMVAALRTLLATCYRDGVAAELVITPSHARLSEALAAVGLWDQLEEWKRTLVRVNEEEAARAGRAPFPLWDFSGFNSLTVEDVPPPGDAETQMVWFWESSHFRKELGDRVLDRVFGTPADDCPLPADFGVRLDTATVEAHLAATRAARAAWRASHPDDVAEIERLAAESAPFRQPPSASAAATR